MEIADTCNLSSMIIRDASDWPRLVPRDGVQWNEMKYWLRDNMSEDYYWQPKGIRIKNSKDAMMFKLKFG